MIIEKKKINKTKWYEQYGMVILLLQSTKNKIKALIDTNKTKWYKQYGIKHKQLWMIGIGKQGGGGVRGAKDWLSACFKEWMHNYVLMPYECVPDWKC